MDRVLVIDDELSIQTLLGRVLAQSGREIATVGSGRDGLKAAADLAPDVVVLDLRLPDASGLEVLRALRMRDPEMAVVIVTGYGEIGTAVEAMKQGAKDYLEKPFDNLDKLRLCISRTLEDVGARRALQRLQQLQARKLPQIALVGDSPATRALRDAVHRLAGSEADTFLILGESGTGKEVVASCLHYESPRRTFAFVDVNCAAIGDALFESELFGHERGAFTDARVTKPGLVELADHGTLFLDEVSELSPSSQAKLLRVMETRSVRRVGGTRDIRLDVRLVAASNRPLGKLVAEGRFREDLYYRLNVIPLAIPPLRERRDDIIPLTRHFLEHANVRFHKIVAGFSEEAERHLLGYPWPGNVRELRNFIERAVLLAPVEVIDVEHLPPLDGVDGVAGTPNGRSLAAVERAYIQLVLRSVGGNKSEAAKVLGISRNTLRGKLEDGETA